MTSCLVTASIASIAATSISPRVGRPPVPQRLGARSAGTTPSSPSFSVAMRLDLEPDAIAVFGSQIAVIAGRA